METIVTGIFDSRAAAARARDALLSGGVAREPITMSESETSDGIAAEAPGERRARGDAAARMILSG
jgi:hypothetical protein